MRNENREVCLEEVLQAVSLIDNWRPTDKKRRCYVGHLGELTIRINVPPPCEPIISISASLDDNTELFYKGFTKYGSMKEGYSEVRAAYKEIDTNYRRERARLSRFKPITRARKIILEASRRR